MLKYLMVVSGILLLVGCSSNPKTTQKINSALSASDSSLIKLSHVKAYLLIGNIKQAQTTFDTIDNPLTIPSALLTLAELRALSGDAVGAQQAFMQALSNGQLDKYPAPQSLIDYFCKQKKWDAIETYASEVFNSNYPPEIKDPQLTSIGLCFFNQQLWNKTTFWLTQLDFEYKQDPKVYLALARANIEQKLYVEAQYYIDEFEDQKTQISPEMLWAAIEVYQALNKPGRANQLADNLRLIFPSWEYQYTRQAAAKTGQSKPVSEPIVIKQTAMSNESIHIIKKGETLYQLSKRYGVSIPELQSWNPSLVIENISVGTKIRITRSQ